ncbi:pyruvate dehydrogenase E2 component (dihydrolipoamide acetyltransferase) [Prosthecobacter debontii]|uniref:Dihydrolipoamide acetyltransferase component of pyruvate dehydrogenase complex n=1 Tax=Prosthecobacter debontii TaxID=48467 RepID=A0A1T4XM79_9BACT|nr:2-oxo acid dehydrogenase subunit E2 [Prosthecobacter debontii]SKA90646.1 pyruvate dehydrogenase E2 component (dihydrolipoamide acetyltransferase) [Prosthecobacter debontii]
MPTIPILMPQLGESIAEATIVRILIEPGQRIEAGTDIFEVETNKATMAVSSPCAGEVSGITALVQKSYAVGSSLAAFDVSDEDAQSLGFTESPAPTVTSQTPVNMPSADSLHFQFNEEDNITDYQPKVEPVVGGALPVPAGATGASYISPRMRARMNELGLNASDLAGIAGTGAGGRVTVEDFENFLRGLEQHRLTPASPMRIAVADSMRRSWSRPLATVGSPVILDAILSHRKKTNPKPGPALYIIRALALALAENTAVAGRLIGSRIVHPRAIDIGFAVEVEDGVLVPVLREVEKTPLVQLVPTYNKLVELARARRLPMDINRPGIATVTNFGTFGIVWATPIPLPEQNLVLGLGAGSKVPHWSDEVKQFIPVTEAELTLSFDHRILDGGGAGRLLARVAQLLQEPEKL